MKTANLYLLIALSIVLLASCQKQCNCECTDNAGQKSTYTMSKGTKTENKQECKSFELSGENSCTLVQCD